MHELGAVLYLGGGLETVRIFVFFCTSALGTWTWVFATHRDPGFLQPPTLPLWHAGKPHLKIAHRACEACYLLLLLPGCDIGLLSLI